MLECPLSIFFSRSTIWVIIQLLLELSWNKYCMNREKHFNPAGIYDHLGEIYSALIIISFVVCCLVFLKVSSLFPFSCERPCACVLNRFSVHFAHWEAFSVARGRDLWSAWSVTAWCSLLWELFCAISGGSVNMSIGGFNALVKSSGFLFSWQGYTYPSSSDWGSCGNPLVDFYWVWLLAVTFVLCSASTKLYLELLPMFLKK